MDNGSLTMAQLMALNDVTKQVIESGNDVSGKWLRMRLRRLPLLNAEFRRLVPKYLLETYPLDRFQLTFDGLLASDRGAGARVMLLAAMRMLLRKYPENPDFHSFSWPELETTGLLPGSQSVRFADFVLKISQFVEHGSTEGNPPVQVWYMHQNSIERLYDAARNDGDLSHFIIAVQGEMENRKEERARMLALSQAYLPGAPEASRSISTGLESQSGENTPPDSQRKQNIFIGHGHSPVWMQLQGLLQSWGLAVVEFNIESAAGYTVKERLEQMLDVAGFAFIVMTAEEARPDASRHARDNVIHEAGLFQGRLGFRKAIILLEQGCAAFSNIEGLTSIKFAPGDIRSETGQIRSVLEREEILR